MWLRNISRSFVRSRKTFIQVNPSAFNLLKIPWITFAKIGTQTIKEVINVAQGKDLAESIGSSIGDSILNSLYLAHSRNLSTHAFNCASNYIPSLNYRGLSATRRSWITSKDKGLDGRIVKKLTMVYHDASIKHVDVHLGHLSLVYRITGKPIESQIKFNNKGMLTEDSKAALLNHVRTEIAKNARVPWNHDHTLANAKTQWAYDSSLKARVSYGSGPTRQVFLEDKVEFYHPEVTSSLHMYAPTINADQGLYIYQIYPATNGKSTPILVWGNLIPRDQAFPDRLHLKMVGEQDYETFLKKSNVRSITRKYDGGSCYFVGSGDVSKAHSFKFFSPRFSKITGHRIEYTYKIPEMCDSGIAHETSGMGELLFWKQNLFGNILTFIGIRKGPEGISWSYLSASEIGGVLNSNKVRDRNIFPELRVYRMDRWDGQDIHTLPFFENRKLQEHLIQDCSCPNWEIVKLVKPCINKSWEGLVGTPDGMSVNESYKIKWKGDAQDWRIDSVNFYLSEKQNIAGVISCTSLESGKHFNLGPGQVGNADRCMSMIESPNDWIGTVLKTQSFGDQEGRAAKVVDVHLDK